MASITSTTARDRIEVAQGGDLAAELVESVRRTVAAAGAIGERSDVGLSARVSGFAGTSMLYDVEVTVSTPMPLD